MRFKLTTSGFIYNKDKAQKLKLLGFSFEYYNENMMYMIKKDDVDVDIYTLEELIAFSTKWGEIIISDGSIEIYDEYRE